MTDTNSGITQEEAKALGIYLLSMPFIIEGQVHFEGKEVTTESFYADMVAGKDISTSQPSPGDVMDMWDKILADGYDEIIYVPMSSGLSASCHSAIQLAEDYDEKVQVADNHRISVTMRDSVMDAKYLADSGMSAKEIKEKLEANAYESVVFLTVDDLKYLKKGGRISPAAAALGAVLNIKPILTTTGDKFEALEKVRGMKKALVKLLDYAQSYVENDLKDYDIEKISIGVAGSLQTQESADEWFELVKERFGNISDIYYNDLSLSIGTHVGPDAAGMGISVILRNKK